MKEMKTTAQVLVDCLEAEGVDVMFGIPGEETLDLMFCDFETARYASSRCATSRVRPLWRMSMAV